jgi:flavin reductase (DIM6/NTAB) family NADH-FMN oxidoreductase RutF
MSTQAEQRRFRDALGRFATGITVVTASTADGSHAGLTVNSFSSVSLDPPLVLWSLSKTAPCFPSFERATHYAVNVLAAGQAALSNRFAGPGEKFADTAWTPGKSGAPLLEGCLAYFECRIVARHDGGDHVILVGEVERYDQRDGEPLLYYAGRYGALAPHPGAA